MKNNKIITKSETSRRNTVTHGPSCIFICILYMYVRMYVCVCVNKL